MTVDDERCQNFGVAQPLMHIRNRDLGKLDIGVEGKEDAARIFG